MLRLSETARHVIQPDGIASTGWPAVRNTCAEIDITFDLWQDGAGRLILAKRVDGLYAADTVVISIPRQVGKTFLVGAIIFALCIIHPGLTVIWTAHRFKTARETFMSMKGTAMRRVMAPHVDPDDIYSGAGNELIGFRNGSRVIFGARERGGGRGFSEVDVLVLDEAQILTANAMDDLVPTTNASRNPLILLTGTPPRSTDPGEVFTMLRESSLSGEARETLYLEFSADRGADPNDRDQWRKANPSFPHRTNERAILRMRKNLSEASFLREGLGVWDERTGGSVISEEMWAKVCDPTSRRDGRGVVFAVDAEKDRSEARIALVCENIAGKLHLEMVEPQRTMTIPEAGERLVQLWKKHRAPVLIASGSPAFSLVPTLRAQGVEVRLLSRQEVRAACGGLEDAVKARTVVHTGRQFTLAKSVAKSRKHATAAGWTWRDDPGTASLRAATLAHYGWPTKRYNPDARSKVVVLQ